MAFGVSSPQYVLIHCRCCRNQASAAEVCEFANNLHRVGHRSASLSKSCSRLVPSADGWSLRHGIQRSYGIQRCFSIRSADESKAGFGRKPVKNIKKTNRPQPKDEADQLARAQQILAQKQQGNEAATSAGALISPFDRLAS